MGALATISGHLVALARRIITAATCADCCSSPWGGPPPDDPEFPLPWPPPADPTVGDCDEPCFAQAIDYAPQPCDAPATRVCLECCCPCAMTYSYVAVIYQYDSAGYSGPTLIWSDVRITHHVEIECTCTGEGTRSCTWRRRITEVERRWDLPDPVTRTAYEDGPLPSFVDVTGCWPDYTVTGCRECGTPGWTITATEHRTCRSRRYACYADTGETEPGVRRIRALDVWSTLTPLDPCAGTISTGPCPAFASMLADDFLGGGA